ncbi:MAG: efflux RND transporter permease subunit [Chloroflexota bacterium]
MSRLTQFAIRQKSVVLLIAVGLFLSGLVAWGQLRQELLPDIELPIITVISALPGAGAEDVASTVTEPIERALQNVPRLEKTQSTSANSLSLVVAQFSYGTDLKETLATINTQLDGATLPEGVNPRVTALNINDQPVIVATVAPAPGADPVEAARIAREIVAPEIRSLEGVSSADLSGGATAVLKITLDPAKLAESGISVGQIQGVIQANQITLPSGTITEGGLRLPISTEHRFTSVDELKNLIVGVKGGQSGAGAGTGGGLFGGGLFGGQGGQGSGQGQGSGSGTGQGGLAGLIPEFVKLGDIADIGIVDVQQTGYARTDGQPSLTLTVSKASGANTVEVADAVTAAFTEIQAENPQVQITTIQDLSIFIKESRDGLVREGLLGALFAVITIWFFLLSIRTTLVAAVSIPLSILIALLVMGLAGLTVNIITLGGLAVAVGRVVDDSIVVLENIFRHRAKGEPIGDAVLNGTKEVAAAITSSTITTVAVFLPIGFVGGIVSQFFLPFGLTVTFALLASLLVALTVIPVLAFFFMRKVNVKLDADGELPETIWQRLYTPALKLALRSRKTKWGTLAITFALFIATLSLVPKIPTSFINSGGEKIVNVTVAPPTGASTDAVIARVGEVEQLLMADQDVELVQSTIPGDSDTGAQTLRSAFSGRAANSATLTVRLKPEANLDVATERLTTTLEPASGDGFKVALAQESGFGGGGFSVIVSGQDRKAIKTASDALVPALGEVEGLTNVESDLAEAAPIVSVAVDPNRAITAGLTTAQVGQQIRTVLVGQQLGSVALDDGRTVGAFLNVDATGVDSVDALKALPVGTARVVPLGDVADVQQAESQGSVTRVDGAPAATISATVTGDNQGQITRETQKVIDSLTASGAIPPGVDVRIAGVAQQQTEAFTSLFAAMGFAILVVYIVMVLVFGSLIDPLVILFSLPLATIGAFPALLITGRPLGISALIGFLMLIGIVVTNAIVLLDLVEQLRHNRGMSTKDALILGGRTRVRPILMTAVATILALLPVAAGLSEGSIIAAELGTVVIGGLFSSTFLTLIVIPVIYSLVDGGKAGVARRFAPKDDEPAAPVAPAAPAAGAPTA